MPESRSRLLRGLASATRWIAPTAAAACTAALAAALVDGAGAPSAFGFAIAAGAIVWLAAPAWLAVSVVLRGLYAGWQPRRLAERWRTPTGSMPRLAAWLGVLALDAVLLAAAAWRGTLWLGTATTFEPLEISWLESTLAAVTVLVLIAVSRPMANAADAVARRVDARLPRLMRPRTLAAAIAALAVAAAVVAWFAIAKPALGVFDTGLFAAPAAGLAAGLIVQLGWRRLGRAQPWLGGGAIALALAAAAVALVAAFAYPTDVLEVWGDRALAGLAVDTAVDIDDIRERVPLRSLAPAPVPGAPHPDIILVTIDTVRADHTPPYGGHAAMPALAGLAARGTVFEHAYSPSNVTRRSIPAMAVGLAANQVRGRVVGWALRVDPRHVLVAERLRAGGYETAGFMCCTGFWGPEAHTGLQRGLEHVEIEPNGAKLARAARTWLDARAKSGDRKPLFLWIHILEPHNWTAIAGEPRNDQERTQFYDRVLAQCDAMLAELVGAYAQRPAAEQAIFVVTADHGEALGEHGHAYHSTDLYNSQIHIPLVLAGPGVATQRVAEIVSTTALASSLMALAGFRPADDMDPAGFADLAAGTRASAPGSGLAFAAMIKDRSNPGGITALVKGSWKVIDDGAKLELYDLVADPDELHDLSSSRPDKLDELVVILRREQAAANANVF